MNRKHLILVLAAITAIAFGMLACKTPAPAPSTVQQPDDADARRRAEEEARKRAEEEARRKREEQDRIEQARRAEAEKLKAFQTAAEAALQDIHFDYDKSGIKPDDKTRLERIAKFMQAWPQAKLLVEGHCDERGTVEYNLALGDRRANAAVDFIAALGVPHTRFSTISYGKERPLCTEANEPCWSRNRRAHFVLKN